MNWTRRVCCAERIPVEQPVGVGQGQSECVICERVMFVNCAQALTDQHRSQVSNESVIQRRVH
jgi:hypothetical protein